MAWNISKIPTNEDIGEKREIHMTTAPVYMKLYGIVKGHVDSSYHQKASGLTEILEFMSLVDAMNCNSENPKKAISTSYKRHAGNFSYLYGESAYYKHIGIIINIDTEPQFHEYTFPEATYLEGAEEALKQSNRHFLKIFHSPNNKNMLFVWSNQDLTVDTVYKLKRLQNAINKENIENFNPYTERIYDAFVEQNLEKINKAFNEFFESDYVKEFEYERFFETFTRDAVHKKERLEYQIRDAYRNIQIYENKIAECGANIRGYSERILALSNVNEMKEELQMLFKYMKKHPYITSFTPSDSADSLILTFRSPLIYYNDYAIEKLKKSYKESKTKIEILDLFLKKRFQLYTQCAIRFYPETFHIDTYHSFDNYDKSIMGHPHIEQYGCLGNHREGVNEAAETNDFIGAIEQISQATLNMNFYDACVANYLLRYLSDEQGYELETWYDTETGEMVGTYEAIRRSRGNETT